MVFTLLKYKLQNGLPYHQLYMKEKSKAVIDFDLQKFISKLMIWDCYDTEDYIIKLIKQRDIFQLS